jgi:serine phosphatase RsbU (regulator of sigma subunit)
MKKILLILFLPIMLFPQKENLNELRKLWNDKGKHDTIRMKALFDLGSVGFLYQKPDTARTISETLLNFASSQKNKKYIGFGNLLKGYTYQVQGDYKTSAMHFREAYSQFIQANYGSGEARALGSIALSFQNMSMYDSALYFFDKTAKLFITQKNFAGMAKVYGNMGNIYKNRGEVDKAVLKYTECIKILEKSDDEINLAATINNLGILFMDQDETEKAMEYFEKAKQIREQLGDITGLAGSYTNIGTVYLSQNKVKEAVRYFEKSYELHTQTKDLKGMAIALNNIGSGYSSLGEKEKAIPYLEKALELHMKMGNKPGITGSLVNIGIVYDEKGDLKKSLEYGEKALALAQESGAVIETRDVALFLYKRYKRTNNWVKSLQMHELYSSMQDSIRKEENKKAVIKQQLKYEYEKKAAADSLRGVEEKKISDAKLQHEKNQRYYLYSGLILVLIFAIFMYNRFKITQKQKFIIEEQKSLVEEKQKEIFDSIHYAKRIQDAYLPPADVLKKFFPESFLLFKPKDIVSGDFYWFYSPKIVKNENTNKIFFAVADCTGHGVPGAIMSVICCNALNEVVVTQGYKQPGEILDRVREIVVRTIKSKDANEQKDGMDISFCCLDLETLQLNYAGANNALWILKHGQNEMQIVKADKQPVGIYSNMNPFTTQSLQLSKGDCLFLYSDGFADQFGGPKGKKLKYAQLQKMLVEKAQNNMNELGKYLNHEFDQWKGNLEQVDDVCVMGIRLKF